MANLISRANNALNANPIIFHYPTTSDINLTTHGSDWYWTVFTVMVVSTFIFAGLSFRVDRERRIFHYITASITMVASIAYFTMAANLGYAATIVEFQRSNPRVAGLYREIFYVRYIDWVVTTPLLLMDLLLTAGLPWPAILYTFLINEIMIITGLVGALTASSYKWGYFVFAMFALFFIAYMLLYVGYVHSRQHFSKNVHNTFRLCGTWTIFLWFLYPVVWGLSEGGNVISSDGEAVFYGVLDILSKPVFGALLLWGHRNIDPVELGLHITAYADNNTGGFGNEKKRQSNLTDNGTVASSTTAGHHNPVQTGGLGTTTGHAPYETAGHTTGHNGTVNNPTAVHQDGSMHLPNTGTHPVATDGAHTSTQSAV